MIAGLAAEAIPGSSNRERPLYASDLVKVKLTAEAAIRSRLPIGLYEETTGFGWEELDLLLAEVGGTAVIRAHRRLKNKAWESEHGFDRWFLIRLDGSSTPEAALAVFKASPWIEDSCFEHYAYTQITPNDPYYAQNWGHNNTGQGPGGGGAGFDSNAPEAWDQAQVFGSPNIIIAIIDSGVNYNHPDLADNCVAGYDYGSNDDNPMDSNGHGTSCSGIAAGITNNGIGVAGVAGGCKIMPIKVMNNSGSMTFTYITNGITHAGDNGAHVISMSLGAEGGTDEGDNPACDNALYYAYNSGCVIFAATANSNAAAIAYPANHTAVISVGAASPTGQRKSPSSSDGQNWWGSNYGVNIQDNPKAVDIMAATILPATTVNGSYSTNFNGTSCATPYAAGVAALVLSKDSALTPAEVRTILTTSATDMTIDGGPGWDRYTGYGMVNADGALALVAPGVPNCVITAPENNSGHELGNLVNVEVNATDDDGTIVSVDFYIGYGITPLHTDYSAPYSWTWDTAGLPPGEYIIRAIATDNEGNYRQSAITVLLLLPAHEGFESGQFSLYAWQNQGPSPWTVQSVETYSGFYAAQAGAISHNQSTSLSLDLIITEPGEISFFRKVSSEANYDFFRFYIDGVQQDQWSGNQDWAIQSYPVQPGFRTFSWAYVKDQGTVSGNDTAWLDHIVFPPHNAPPAAPSNLTAFPVSPTRILLTWTDNSTDEEEFYIETLTGNVWSLIDWVEENGTVYTGSGLTPLTTYSYRVRAYNSNGNSNYSNVASVTTLGSDSPDNVVATAQGNVVNLVWDTPPAGADSYQLWRFELVGGSLQNGVLLTPVQIITPGFTDNDWHLQPAGNFLWNVVAINGSILSYPSLSNLLSKPANGTVIGSVTDLAGSPLENACVSCDIVSASTNPDGSYALSLLPGSYSITASHPSYQSVTLDNVQVSSDLNFIANFQLPLLQVETPAFDPEPGDYSSAVDVALSCATESAEIRYTLDGSEPGPTAELYTHPIHLEATTTVLARAFKDGYADSEIAEGVYSITVSNQDPLAPALAGIQSIYPNPFSGTAQIRLQLKPGTGDHTLSIYNLRGELVDRNTISQKGELTLTFSGRDSQNRRLGSGIYLIRLQGEGLDQVRKVVLQR